MPIAVDVTNDAALIARVAVAACAAVRPAAGRHIVLRFQNRGAIQAPWVLFGEP